MKKPLSQKSFVELYRQGVWLFTPASHAWYLAACPPTGVEPVTLSMRCLN